MFYKLCFFKIWLLWFSTPQRGYQRDIQPQLGSMTQKVKWSSKQNRLDSGKQTCFKNKLAQTTKSKSPKILADGEFACLLNKLRFAFVTIRLQSQSFGLFKLFIFYLFCFLDLKYRLSKNFNPIICDIINNQLFRIFQDVLLIGIVGKHSHETFLKVSEINLSIMNTNLLKIFKINWWSLNWKMIKIIYIH